MTSVMPSNAKELAISDWNALAKARQWNPRDANRSLEIHPGYISDLTVTTTAQAIAEAKVTGPIGVLIKYRDPEFVALRFAELFLYLNEALPVSQQMTKEQRPHFIRAVQAFNHLGLAEIKLAFDRGIACQYGREGQIFGQLSIANLQHWLQSYSQERLEIHEEEGHLQHDKIKNASVFAISDETARANFLAAFEKMEKVADESAPEKKTPFYRDIHHYCEMNLINPAVYAEEVNRKAALKYSNSKEVGIPFDDYLDQILETLLADLRAGRHPININPNAK